MFHPFSILKAAGLGAGMMYFLDPELGPRRRESVKNKITNVYSTTNQKAEAIYHDATDRIEGAKDDLYSLLESTDVPIVERLQKGAAEIGDRLGMRSDGWTPTAKAAAALGGLGLVTALMRKRDIGALALAVTGLAWASSKLIDTQCCSDNEEPKTTASSSRAKKLVKKSS